MTRNRSDEKIVVTAIINNHDWPALYTRLAAEDQFS